MNVLEKMAETERDDLVKQSRMQAIRVLNSLEQERDEALREVRELRKRVRIFEEALKTAGIDPSTLL